MFHSIDLLISVLVQHINMAKCLCIKTWVPSDPDDPKMRRVHVGDYYLYLTPVPYDGGEIAYEMTAVHIPSGYRWMVQHEVTAHLENNSLGQLYEQMK